MDVLADPTRSRPSLDALLTAYRLKDEPRRGWVLRGVDRPESVADHSWGTALLCFLYADAAGIDRGRALEVALAHDIAEAIAGDVANRLDPADREVSLEEKARREAEAIDELLPAGTPGGAELRGRWREYEERGTPEALFVRDMNLIDMCLQALLYELEDRHAYPDGLGEFFASAEARLGTDVGRALYTQVAERFRETEAVKQPARRPA